MTLDLRQLLIGVLVILLGVFGWIRYSAYKADMEELAQLRETKSSYEARDKVTAGARESFQTQMAAKDAQTAANTAQRIIIEQRTIEVAHEDQATADFLATPIPERLREADREARLARGLGSGERARGPVGEAD